MSKIAIVTGGTRGIGEAISKGLKEAGYKVAATYAGNDAAAEKFKKETGVAVYKWDVGDPKACAEGLAKVEAELGPVDVLVNNAGITKDGMFHRMTPEQWSAVIRTNLDSLFNMDAAGDRRHARAGLRPHHLDLLDQWPERADGPGHYLDRQGGRDRLQQGSGARGMQNKGITGERDRARPDRDLRW